MCSVAFIHHAGFDQKKLESAINRMNEIGAHRGPDDSRVNLYGKTAIGHNRLSIIDPNPRSSQPMEYGDLVMAFNGCLYNYIELKEVLQGKGYEFQTSSDTEVILKAFAEWGEDCLPKFNGMWALVIYNKLSGMVFMARDRYGIKPLYWYQSKRSFFLASEIKQILPFSGAELHPGNQYDYFVYGRIVHNNSTLHKDVNVFPAGSFAWYDTSSHHFEVNRYYSLPVNNVVPDLEYLKDLIHDSIRIRLRSDVKNGVTVSGGMDSSIIAAVASSFEPGEFTLFNASFPGADEDESGYARELAEYLKRPIVHGTSSWSDFTSKLAKLSYIQEIPIGSFAVFASFELQRLISGKGVKVILSGQGADEIFGGYTKFHFHYLKNLLRSGNVYFFSELYQALALDQYSYAEIINKAKNFKNSLFKPHPHWIKLPAGEPDGQALVQRNSKKGLWRTSNRAISGMGLPVMLHALDRNSMYFGIESRCPFLDHRLVDYAINLPDRLKIKNGKRKYVLRELFGPELPNSVSKRFEKKGYSSPQSTYMNQNKGLILNDIMDRKELFQEFIDPGALEKEIRVGRNESLIWRIWTWTFWREKVLTEASENSLLRE